MWQQGAGEPGMANTTWHRLVTALRRKIHVDHDDSGKHEVYLEILEQTLSLIQALPKSLRSAFGVWFCTYGIGSVGLDKPIIVNEQIFPEIDKIVI